VPRGHTSVHTLLTARDYAYRTGDGEYWGGAGGWFASSDAFNVFPAYQRGYGIPTNILTACSPMSRNPMGVSLGRMMKHASALGDSRGALEAEMNLRRAA
jgi:hypothetical protein